MDDRDAGKRKDGMLSVSIHFWVNIEIGVKIKDIHRFLNNS